MNPVFAIGLQAFTDASARLNTAAGRTVRAGSGLSGGTARENGWGDDIVQARADMIRAQHQAAAAASIIRAASDAAEARLDIRV
jgi:hypothetical protein